MKFFVVLTTTIQSLWALGGDCGKANCASFPHKKNTGMTSMLSQKTVPGKTRVGEARGNEEERSEEVGYQEMFMDHSPDEGGDDRSRQQLNHEKLEEEQESGTEDFSWAQEKGKMDVGHASIEGSKNFHGDYHAQMVDDGLIDMDDADANAGETDGDSNNLDADLDKKDEYDELDKMEKEKEKTDFEDAMEAVEGVCPDEFKKCMDKKGCLDDFKEDWSGLNKTESTSPSKELILCITSISEQQATALTEELTDQGSAAAPLAAMAVAGIVGNMATAAFGNSLQAMNDWMQNSGIPVVQELGQVREWVCGFFGLGSSGPSNQDIMNAVAEVAEDTKEIKKDVKAIQQFMVAAHAQTMGAIDEMAKDMGLGFKQVGRQLESISSHIVTRIISLEETTKQGFNDLTSQLAGVHEALQAWECEKIAVSITTRHQHLYTHMKNLRSLLTGYNNKREADQKNPWKHWVTWHYDTFMQSSLNEEQAIRKDSRLLTECVKTHLPTLAQALKSQGFTGQKAFLIMKSYLSYYEGVFAESDVMLQQHHFWKGQRKRPGSNEKTDYPGARKAMERVAAEMFSRKVIYKSFWDSVNNRLFPSGSSACPRCSLGNHRRMCVEPRKCMDKYQCASNGADCSNLYTTFYSVRSQMYKESPLKVPSKWEYEHYAVYNQGICGINKRHCCNTIGCSESSSERCGYPTGTIYYNYGGHNLGSCYWGMLSRRRYSYGGGRYGGGRYGGGGYGGGGYGGRGRL